MKRKVNRVGTNTLTVSLPSAWCRKTGVSVGDEVDVVEDNNVLVVSKGFSRDGSSLTINVTGLGKMLSRTLCAVYKAGYDAVTIIYKTPEELAMVQETLDRTCHVYEVLDVSKDKVRVKAISSLDSGEFPVVLRKMGFVLLDMADEMVEMLEKKDYEGLKTVILKDRMVDRHTDFCRRLLNSGFVPSNYKRVLPLYTIIEQTEVLADIYKDLSSYILEKGNVDNLKLLKEVNSFVRLFYDTFYKFSFERIVEIGVKAEALRVKFKKMKTPYLRNIFETCFEMKSVLLTLYV